MKPESPERQIARLHDLGVAVSNEGQADKALRLFEEAMELARTVGNQDLEAHCRVHVSEALEALGRLRAALTTLSPLVQKPPAVSHAEASENTLFDFGLPDAIALAVLSYATIGLRLPVQAASIERALNAAQSVVPPNHMTLMNIGIQAVWVKLRVAQERLDDALQIAQRARTMHGPDEMKDLLHMLLARVLFARGEYALARRYAARSHDAGASLDGQIAAALFEAQLCRAEGRIEDGLRAAKQAASLATNVQDYRTRREVAAECASALLASGDHSGARVPISALIQLRRSESLWDLCQLHLLLGDYRLTRALGACGLLRCDVEYSSIRITIATDCAEPPLQKWVRSAHSAFCRAAAVSQEIGRLLSARVNERVLQRRHEWLVALGERRPLSEYAH